MPDKDALNNRYQFQPWIVKLWRHRHYLVAYWLTAKYTFNYYLDRLRASLEGPRLPKLRECAVVDEGTGKIIAMMRPEDPPLQPSDAYGLYIGLAHSKMEWWYTWNETWSELERWDKLREQWDKEDAGEGENKTD